MVVYGSITRGTVTQVLAGSTARILETVHRPHSSIDWHEHEDLSVDVVIAGSFQEHVSGEVFDRGVGSLIIKPSGVSHRNAYGARGTRTVVVHISPTSPLLEDFGHLFTRVRHECRAGRGIAARLAGVLAAGGVLAMTIDDAIIVGLAELTPLSRNVAPRTLGAMRARVLDDTLSGSLTSIAEEFGMSPSAFSHAFRSHYGCTPSTMLRRRRMDRACQLLRSGTRISEVAATSGFADQAHFTRECRKLLGVTPSQYRRSVS